MSNTINATVHTDPEISSIRSLVAGKNDGIPFTLFPVRIETRFMLVDKPLFAVDVYTSIFTDLSEITRFFGSNHFPPTDPKVNVRLEEITRQLSELPGKSNSIKRMSAQDKTNLLHVIDTLQSQLKETSGSMQSNKKLAVRNTSSGSGEFILPLIQQVEKLHTNVSLLLTNEKEKTAATEAFMGHVDSINKSIQQLAGDKINVSGYKDKRKWFSQIETQFASIENGMSEVRLAMTAGMTASTDQLQLLTKTLSQLAPGLSILKKNLATLKSAYKKAEYISKIKDLGQQLGTLKKEIDTVVRPKLLMQKQFKKTDAREVLFHSTGVLQQLTHFNFQSDKKKAFTKIFRDNLLRNLKHLNTATSTIIEGSDDERQAISSTSDQADQAITDFLVSLKSIESKNPTEKNTLDSFISLVNQYRQPVSALKSDKKSGIPLLTNQLIDQNVQIYERTVNSIKKLTKELSKTTSDKEEPKRVEALMDEVIKLNRDFSTQSRELHIIPAVKLKELQKHAAELEKSVTDKLEAIGADSPEGKKAATDIKARANAQVSDKSLHENTFVKDGRNSIVHATSTVTKKELWVRIYPDDIAIQTHENALTQAEVDSGKAYWYEIWAAGADKDLRLAAWRALTTAYGPQRAAWIVKELEPVSSEAVNGTFPNLSGNLSDLNILLESISNRLDKGAKENTNIFEVLQNVFPDAEKASGLLGKMESAHDTLLRKSGLLLSNVQKKVAQYLKAVEKINRDKYPVTEKELMSARSVQKTFGNILEKFKKVRPVKGGEIIRNNKTEHVFPNVTTKESSWTEAPHSRIMPNRFVVAAMRDGVFRYLEAGNELTDEKLVVGLDPSTFESSTFAYDADNNLIVDDKIKWMTDFNEALLKGMAISFELQSSDWEHGFDKVFVIGVKNTTQQQGKKLIEDLMENHHFAADGAAFLPVGTPTNNTSSSQSGYLSYEEDASNSFEVERNEEDGDTFLANAAYPSDSERLAKALGIDQEIFRHLHYSDSTNISDALNVNKALFNGTIGNYMEEGLDLLFNLDNINRVKKFFTNYVSARGSLPSIRVGAQPYGILAVSALRYFECTSNDLNLPVLTKESFENTAAIETDLQKRFDIRLKNFVRLMNNYWTSIRDGSVADGTHTIKRVKHAADMPNADNVQAYFMDMLGLEATSAEVYYRYGLNIAARQESNEVGEFSLNFLPGDIFGPTSVSNALRDQVIQGYYYKSDDFWDESSAIATTNDKYVRIQNQFNGARIFYIRHLQDQAQLLGLRIDYRALSESLQTPSPVTGTNEQKLQAQSELENYIDWMLGHTPWDVHASNQFEKIDGAVLKEGMPSKSMLFMLLRHSLLSAYADTMMKILEHEGLLSQKIRKMLGQATHYLTPVDGHMRYVTKWNYLFGKIAPLQNVLENNMDVTNSFYSYMNNHDYYLNWYLSPVGLPVFNNYPQHANHTAYIDELNETKAAITKLKSIPTTQLDRMLGEHLDICTYRLDAWYLGFVNKRLQEQRATHATGSFVGAYGWVENLRRGPDRSLAGALPSELWKSGDGPVYSDPGNLGYIHTPSLNHAITAAILRAGFKANESVAETENQMAINLSSGRVRMALTLLSGIRNGQESGALLGYQFERGLHERYTHLSLELDEFIYDFRELFPLSLAVDETLTPDQIAQTQVVNGLDLLEYAQDFIDNHGGPPNPGDSLYQSLKAHETTFWTGLSNANLSAAGDDEKDAMLLEIDRMADAFDALGDLCMSESVYQVAQGNHVRASAILDKLAAGDVPNEITIADTPRSGTIVTQKVALFIPRIAALDHALTESETEPLNDAAIALAVTAASARPTGWNSAFTPRAILEPTLNKYIGELIGDPSKIKCSCEYTVTTETLSTTTPVTVSMENLALQPLDILHLFATGALNGGTELNARVANYVRTQIGALPIDFAGTADDVPVTIYYTERDPSWTSDDFSFYEKSGYLLSLREMLTSSGILSADHLHIPGEEVVSQNEIRNQDVNELLIRVTNGVERMQIIFDELDDFFTSVISPEDTNTHIYTNAEIDTLRTLLTKASYFGIPSSLPELQFGYTITVGQTLMTAAYGTYKAIADRLTRAEQELINGNNVTLPNDSRVNALVQAARCIMEASFRIWPQFTLRNATELNQQLSLSTTNGLLRAAQPHAMEFWWQGIARVRERMAILDTVQLHALNFGNGLSDPAPVQLPFALDSSSVAVDHWLGLPFPAGYSPSNDKLSVAIFNPAEITTNSAQPKVALLIDEWVEIIPKKEETTGLTFNYNQPDAKAPNTILIAVTPQVTGHWSLDNLVWTLHDTLELSKNRAVEPEHLENTIFGQILPGILTEIVPPQLVQQETEDSAFSNPLGYQVVTDFKVNNETYEEEPEI